MGWGRRRVPLDDALLVGPAPKRVRSQPKRTGGFGKGGVSVNSPLAPTGFSRASLEITPGDDLAGDDVRLVAIDNSEPEPILFVTSDRRQRDALYFGAAVGASRSARFRVETASAGEAERRNPNDYALIVLSDVGNLSTGFENKVREWTEQGGAVLVAVGPAISTRGSRFCACSRARKHRARQA